MCADKYQDEKRESDQIFLVPDRVTWVEWLIWSSIESGIRPSMNPVDKESSTIFGILHMAVSSSFLYR
jgi:hypothetical protein